MIIHREIALRDFQPWAGAKAVFKRLTTEELDTLDELLTYDAEAKTYTETEINDIFWFEDEWICETLGIDHEEFWEREVKPPFPIPPYHPCQDQYQ